MRFSRHVAFRVFIALVLLWPARLAAQEVAPPEWLTEYERSNYRRTPRYAETVAFAQRLDRASSWVRYLSFGRSPQGRDLPLVVVSREQAFTPRAASASGKSVVFLQAGIHAGEIDGKDAGLMLVRDMAITKPLAHLLDHAILLFVPILNVDGHERFGPFNRINQNGPDETGWRVTAQNLNLNRDYMKADTPEMRALLALFTAWKPDFYIDCHVTDGIDFQYDVTYTIETGPNINRGVASWIQQRFLPSFLPAVETSGHKIFWYVFPREDHNLSKGLQGGASTPRLSTGYWALLNRPGLLIETHSLKPYRARVNATYHVVKAALQTINASFSDMRSALRAADESVRQPVGGSRTPEDVPVRWGVGPDSVLLRFLGIQQREEPSDISGGTRTVFTGEPIEQTVPFFGQVQVLDSVRVPYAYLIPPEWTFVLPLFDVHGIGYERTTRAESLAVESYSFSEVKFALRPYEGRHGCTYKAQVTLQRRLFPAGTYVVRTNQRARNVLIHLLEPGSPDSFVAWGFFNAVFEQKEYSEGYVMERLAGEMLQNDPALRTSFNRKIAADSSFARNPSARLNWLYLHSPYADPQLNQYPVGRIFKKEALQTVR